MIGEMMPVTPPVSNPDDWVRYSNGDAMTIVSGTVGATTVVFNNVPYSDDYGIAPWVDTSESDTPNCAPPSISNVAIGTPSNALCTVTLTISAVTAAQRGCKWRLRAVR